ncbi:MAG: Dihydroorotate dehydrogenase [Chlamydiae bacterium]|nr:Dihydroorotate dehydrogenase [Chlamydiota bacterium]
MIEAWWPKHPPIYDIHKSYADNLRHGPRFNFTIPKRERPPQDEWSSFLGHNVASKVGVPAGPLLDSKWTHLASELGYDIITYKTIRSQKHASHPLPNCHYVDIHNPLNPKQLPSQTTILTQEPKRLSELSITNSFGMPSQDQKVLQEDLPLAIKHVMPGQVLVVSITGTPSAHTSFIEDFKNIALFAKDCGAPIVEANFSCPNVVSKEGSLFLDPKQTFEVASALTRALNGIPLILKFGVFPNKELMREVFIAAAKAKVHAISGINTISMEVKTKDNQPALGPNRLKSGICGSAIFPIALSFMEDAVSINQQEKLNLTLIGVGGVMKPGDIDTFLEKGADCVQSATGMMWDPLLALRYHSIHKKNKSL